MGIKVGGIGRPSTGVGVSIGDTMVGSGVSVGIGVRVSVATGVKVSVTDTVVVPVTTNVGVSVGTVVASTVTVAGSVVATGVGGSVVASAVGGSVVGVVAGSWAMRCPGVLLKIRTKTTARLTNTASHRRPGNNCFNGFSIAPSW
jgi:hypothetical protein